MKEALLAWTEGPADGRTNMGRDLELWKQADEGRGAARVYSWDGPWVSLGFAQRPEDVFLHPDIVPWVMRPTGGKAVLHGHDVTVGLALPLSWIAINGEDPRNLARRIRTVYRRTAPVLIRALHAAGVPAALGDETRFVSQPGREVVDCFASVAPNDIVDPLTGQKVCGCALRVGDASLLIQASIPAGTPLVSPSSVFAGHTTVSFCQVRAEDLALALNRELQHIAGDTLTSA